MKNKNKQKCEKCNASLEGGEEFIQCHDESKQYKDCGTVWCMDCYEKEDGAWYYEDADALPSADDILVHTDLCPKCNHPAINPTLDGWM